MTGKQERTPPRSILLVAQFSPPSGQVAARRIEAMTKYLAREGHAVTVLTSMVSGHGPIEGARHVVRTRDLLMSRLNWRRKNLRALEGGGGAYLPPSALARWIVPDLSVGGWLPFALASAMRLVRNERFDCVLTSSPPESVHLVGAALQRRGLPWVAELRDGWGFERTPARRWPQPMLAIDGRLEKLLLTRADITVGVTEPIVSDLRNRLGLRAATVTNGFDPELQPQDLENSGPLRAERRLIVHTGRMGAADRSPRPVLEALARLRRSSPDVAGALELVFAGPLSAEEEKLLSDPQLGDMVRWVGSLAPDEAKALQRTAHALLLFTEPARPGHVPAKLYEYLSASRPIIVLGEETESSRLVLRAAAGVAVPDDDPAAIARALEQVVTGTLDRPSPDRVACFGYPALADRLVAVIDEARES